MPSQSSPIPSWSNSIWIYPGYPGNPYDAQWQSDALNMIANYNADTNTCSTCAINMVYPYGTDLELPWANGGDATALNDPSQVGFYFDSKAPGILATYANMEVNKKPINVSPIIDGRIDNGYLQDLNGTTMTEDDVKALAYTVVKGGTSLVTFQNGVGYYASTTNSTTGTVANGISGIQFDLEPVDSSQPLQAAFYTEVGRLLAETNQYFSIFTFPKQLTPATATMLNANNNGYAIIALYDLIDMETVPATTCAPYTLPFAEGCDTSTAPLPIKEDQTLDSANVPHSSAGHYNAAYVTAMQTIALAKSNNIKYKFAIPAGPSVHEFVKWGLFECTYPNVKRAEKYVSCKPGAAQQISGKGPGTQKTYAQNAINAINQAIKDSTIAGVYDSNLFVGVDIWGLSKISPWTASPIIIDWDSGDYMTCYPGDSNGCTDLGNDTSTCLGAAGNSDSCSIAPTYVYTATEEQNADGSFTRGYPTQDVLTYLQTNLDPRPKSS
jgi:hypothetical protein